VPVRRPIGCGYIDLLGAGKDGRIRVIETKLGPFERLVVQGLDYWIWASANARDLAEWLNLPAEAGIDIEYVVAEKTPGKHGIKKSGKIKGLPAREGRVSLALSREDARLSGRMEDGGRHGWLVVLELPDTFGEAHCDSVLAWYLFDEEELRLNQTRMWVEEWARDA
jgi:hypothetical protein